MTKLLITLTLALFFAISAFAEDEFFEDYAAKTNLETINELSQWARRLPAVANLGRAYIGCVVRKHASPATFNRDFEACWSGHDKARSCAYRCGGPYYVYGFYAPSETGPGAIQHVIYCRCDNVVHNYSLYPVPAVVLQQE